MYGIPGRSSYSSSNSVMHDIISEWLSECMSVQCVVNVNVYRFM